MDQLMQRLYARPRIKSTLGGTGRDTWSALEILKTLLVLLFNWLTTLQSVWMRVKLHYNVAGVNYGFG